jgi:DNA-binding response OmpR family regulator
VVVLIAEDEPGVVEALGLGLRFQWPDCEVLVASTGTQALALAKAREIDLMLLDINLPDTNGYGVLKEVRRTSQVPVIIISGRKDELDKVRGLELGADDYLVKPFGHLELLARIKAVLRRAGQPQSGRETASYYDGYLGIDFRTHEVAVGGRRLNLTPHEYSLLRLLVGSSGHTIPHQELLAKLWGGDHRGELGYLRVYIRRLREKIEPNPADPQYLLTDRAFGYRFEPSPFARH